MKTRKEIRIMQSRSIILWVLCILAMLFCSLVQAAEWKLISADTPEEGERPRGWINQLALHPTRSNVLYAATEDSGVIVSEDSGINWKSAWIPKRAGLTQESDVGVSGYRIRCLAIDPIRPGVMYAGMAMLGVFKTTDYGDNWVEMNEMLPDTYARAMAIHPSKPDTLYLGTYGGGMYQRISGSSRWKETIEGMKNTYIRELVMDPSDRNVMYVATNGGMSKSINGGNNWTSINRGLATLYILSLAMDPENTGILYAGTDGKGLFKTENSGSDWVSVGGDIWTIEGLPKGLEAVVSSVIVNPVNPSIVYAANSSGMFRSTDSGQTWSKMNAGLPETDVRSLAVTHTEPITVYAGIASGSIFAYTEE